jgi:hypothetical protein
LLKILKTFVYYAGPESASLTLNPNYKSGANLEIIAVCSEKFYLFFNENMIKNILNVIISELLPFSNEKIKQNEESLIENGNLLN